jgi:3-methyladenine DNA glycosylase/8-oxoguanine DNA glycosylase
MVSQLVAMLGEPYPGDSTLHAFPTPEAIAQTPLDVFIKIVQLGYRGPYIHRLAQQVVSGELDLKALRDPSIPTDMLNRSLRAIKGMGAYATHPLLMLLGRYEELAIDSAMRAFISQHYFRDKNPYDKEMCGVYKDWGRWRYLAYWFDHVGSS